MPTSRLYIIGNGFDKHHGIPSGYGDLKNYVENQDPELYQMLDEYFDHDDLWNHFEETLAWIDVDTILEDATDFLESYGSDDWSDADNHRYQQEIDKVIRMVTVDLRNNFIHWVLGLGIEVEPSLQLDPKAQFLTFNYTSTLETVYGIRDEQILHIHNIAENEESNLILGHGREFNEEESLAALNDEETDVRVAEGNRAIDQYFIDTYKNSKSIITENANYFKKLSAIKEIFILGQSISDVDILYFSVVHKNVDQDCQWMVSYHDPDKKESLKTSLVNIGVPEKKIKMISWDSLK